jgi:ribonuclease HI
MAEIRDERDLNIYTDGSSYSGPRRGGIGILFVTVDGNGQEVVDEYPLPGYAGATNNQMELRAVIEAFSALVTRRAPVRAGPWRRIVIWTDSTYLVDGYQSARFTWPQTGWMTRNGNPVANAELWRELIRLGGRTGTPVEVRWVKGHKTSAYNKAADKAAKRSAAQQTDQRVSQTKVRRKMTSNSVESGSVGMHGQRLTIRVISDEYLTVQKLNKYRYEVMSRASPYFGKVDFIFSDASLCLSAGHTYHVRVNSEARSPRVVKAFREIVV